MARGSHVATLQWCRCDGQGREGGGEAGAIDRGVGDGAAHGVAELAGDQQAQAAAPEARRGRAAHVGVEEGVDEVDGHAGPVVAHREVDDAAGARGPHVDAGTAVAQCVGDQVVEDLRHAQRVGECHRVGVQVEHDLGARGELTLGEHLAAQAREADRLEGQGELAALDLVAGREVDEQSHQHVAAPHQHRGEIDPHGRVQVVVEVVQLLGRPTDDQGGVAHVVDQLCFVVLHDHCSSPDDHHPPVGQMRHHPMDGTALARCD